MRTKITDDRSFDADGNGSPNASETGIHAPNNDGTSEIGTNSSSSSASADSESDTALLSEFQAVYQLLADEGQLPADGMDALSISYSAKGTPYVVFSGNTVRHRYDPEPSRLRPGIKKTAPVTCSYIIRTQRRLMEKPKLRLWNFMR